MKLRTYLKVRRVISAAHFLPGHPRCGKLHGHNYVITATFTGEMDARTGMIADFADLRALVDMAVAECDHNGDLNTILPWEFQPPTSENLAGYIHWRICAITAVIRSGTDLELCSVEVEEKEGMSAIVEVVHGSASD